MVAKTEAELDGVAVSGIERQLDVGPIVRVVDGAADLGLAPEAEIGADAPFGEGVSPTFLHYWLRVRFAESRLERLAAVPILSRSAIHFSVIVVSFRNVMARSTFALSPFRRFAKSNSIQPKACSPVPSNPSACSTALWCNSAP